MCTTIKHRAQSSTVRDNGKTSTSCSDEPLLSSFMGMTFFLPFCLSLYRAKRVILTNGHLHDVRKKTFSDHLVSSFTLAKNTSDSRDKQGDPSPLNIQVRCKKYSRLALEHPKHPPCLRQCKPSSLAPANCSSSCTRENIPHTSAMQCVCEIWG